MCFFYFIQMSSEYSLCTLSPLLCLLFSPSATTVAHWLPSLSFCSRSPWWGHQGHLYCQIQWQFSGLILLDICVAFDNAHHSLYLRALYFLTSMTLKSADISLTLPSLYLWTSLHPPSVCFSGHQCSAHWCPHAHPWGSVLVWGFHSACRSPPWHLCLQSSPLTWVSASHIQSHAGNPHLGVHSFFQLANMHLLSPCSVEHEMLAMVEESIPPLPGVWSRSHLFSFLFLHGLPFLLLYLKSEHL